MAISRRSKKDQKAAKTDAAEVPPKKDRPSFLKRGADADTAVAHEKAKADARKAASGNAWRYYIKVGTQHDSEKDGPTVTVLDGNLREDGKLDIPVVREHEVRRPNAQPQHFVCLSDIGDGSCPLCDAADDENRLFYRVLGFLTVIDHSTHIIKNGPNKGKSIVNDKKLLACSQSDMERLQKIATKCGGLAGVQFEVSRGEESRSPRIGDTWWPLNADDHATPEEIREAYGETDKDGKLTDKGKAIADPLDYEEALNFLDAAELRALGFGAETEPDDDVDPTDTGESSAY